MVRVKVCDKCKKVGEDVGRIVLRIEYGKKAKYKRFGDLCGDCQQKLVEIIKQFFS